MFEIESVVWGFLFLLGVGCIFGLLFWLIGYLERQASVGPEPGTPPLLWRVLRIFLAVALVLVLIGFILQLMGHPVINMGTRRPM